MIQEKLVSVVVPVYNQQNKVAKCLKSIISQSYQKLQILIIDDGSTDNSPQILEKYAKADHRIEIIKQENQGLESTRFVGIEYARGEYLTFVDSDDWLDYEAIKKMVEAIEKERAQVCVCSFWRVFDKYGRIKKGHRFPHDIITNKQFINTKFPAFFGAGSFPVNIWGKLYKLDLLKQEKLMRSNVFYGEDLCLNLQILPRAEKIVVLPDELYFYRWGGGTTMLKESLIEDAYKQYEMKRKYFNEYDKGDYAGELAFELVQFYLGYYESQLISQKRGRWLELTERVFSDGRFQVALQCIPSSLESEKVKLLKKVIQNEDFEHLLTVLSKTIPQKKIKKNVINTIGTFLS